MAKHTLGFFVESDGFRQAAIFYSHFDCLGHRVSTSVRGGRREGKMMKKRDRDTGTADHGTRKGRQDGGEGGQE